MKPASKSKPTKRKDTALAIVKALKRASFRDMEWASSPTVPRYSLFAGDIDEIVKRARRYLAQRGKGKKV